jgi:hypothetical protein
MERWEVRKSSWSLGACEYARPSPSVAYSTRRTIQQHHSMARRMRVWASSRRPV